MTNKEGKGKKGSVVACIKGTASGNLIDKLSKISELKRNKVKEVTLDMARNMEATVRLAFPKATLVTDRFHVVKLVIEAIQHVRKQHRWKAIDLENEQYALAKKEGRRYTPDIYENGDTRKQLLARSRHLLAKASNKWTDAQKLRAIILFREYPDIKMAYEYMMEFRKIYNTHNKDTALHQLKSWMRNGKHINIPQFNTAINSIDYHLDHILNFFDNRNTNANAESFNSKIKLFRANLRGVTDQTFFLFRLMKLFA